MRATWGVIYRRHLRRGEDHGSAAHAADQWEKRQADAARGDIMAYDSTEDTREHIRQVNERLKSVCVELRERGMFHDLSKFGPEEKPLYDVVVPKLNGLKYGTDEHRAALRELGPATAHHYAENTHHPEHYHNGISGMDLLDVVEMYCDWAAASVRSGDGDMTQGIEINIKRFGIDGPLAEILRNTWARHGGFCGYQGYHLDAKNPPDSSAGWTREIDGGTGQGFWRKPKPNTAYEK